MPSFIKGSAGASTPFGRNEYVRSVRDLKFESYTLAYTSVPETPFVDGNGISTSAKILQPGTLMAKITTAAGTSTAADVGKVGPFQAGVTDGRQTLANIVGVNDTFLPWQTWYHDVEIATCYEGTLVQAWCIMLDATGARIPVDAATVAALVARTDLALMFR